MLDNGPDLVLGDERTLDAHRLVLAHREEQAIPLPDQLLGARLIEDDAAVGEARGGEGEPTRNVGLDEARHHVDARALRREDEVDSGCARELRDPHDRLLDIARGDHHEVRQFVDDDEEIRVRTHHPLASGRGSQPAGCDRLVEVVEVAEAEEGKVVVSTVHFRDDPLEGIGGLLRVRDDRRDEMRNALVRRQLNPLRIDENKTHFIRGRPHEHRGDERVDAARLACARGPGDEDVGHLREVRADEAALDVLAERGHHWVLLPFCCLASQDIAKEHQLTVGIRDLDPDRLLPRDRTENPDVGTRHCVRDVLAQRRHSFDLDARAELDLIARNGRPSHEAGHLRVDPELLHDLGERLHDKLIGLRRGLVRGPCLEKRHVRKHVHSVARQRQLLGLASRGALRRGRPLHQCHRLLTTWMHGGRLRLTIELALHAGELQRA